MLARIHDNGCVRVMSRGVPASAHSGVLGQTDSQTDSYDKRLARLGRSIVLLDTPAILMLIHRCWTDAGR